MARKVIIDEGACSGCGTCDLSELDSCALPRGRVRYNEKRKKFEIIADQHILEVDRFINRIIQEFHLKKSDVELKEDENYRCSLCEND